VVDVEDTDEIIVKVPPTRGRDITRRGDRGMSVCAASRTTSRRLVMDDMMIIIRRITRRQYEVTSSLFSMATYEGDSLMLAAADRSYAP
jgi:hypothetical protein